MAVNMATLPLPGSLESLHYKLFPGILLSPNGL